MTEVESSTIVILSEDDDDDDDDDDIVVLKEEKLLVDDDSDSDEVIFISQSQPTASPKVKSDLGPIKSEPSSSKDLSRNLSLSSSLDLSLTLNGPLDLSKHTEVDIACDQNSTGTAAEVKVVDKESPSVDLEITDPQQSISHDLLGSISGSSIDNSFDGIDSQVSDTSTSSSDAVISTPASPVKDLKWNNQPSTSSSKSIFTQNLNPSADLNDKTSPKSVFDEFLELLDKCDDITPQASTDNQPCVSSNVAPAPLQSTTVSAAPTIINSNDCDSTKSSSPTCLSLVSNACSSQVSGNASSSLLLTPKSPLQCGATAPGYSSSLDTSQNDVGGLPVQRLINETTSATSTSGKPNSSVTLNCIAGHSKPEKVSFSKICSEASNTPKTKSNSSSHSLSNVLSDCGSVSSTSSFTVSAFGSLSSASPDKSAAPGSGLSHGKLAQHSLPPRKRVRPDTLILTQANTQRCKEVCVNCKCAVDDANISRCSQGHHACGTCLANQVKLILTDKQGSLECISPNCYSYYQISELKHTLPPMVVEILEEKMHKDNINFAADMILKYAGNNTDQPSTSKGFNLTTTVNLLVDDVTSPKKPKVEDDDDFLDIFGQLKEIQCTTAADKKLSAPNPEHPSSWDPMENMSNLMLMRVEPESGEFVDIAFKFHESLSFPKADIVKISRVQNPILWKYYNLKRTEMIQEHDCHVVDERQLFHGTSSSVIEAICRKGFDWRVCGKHGSVYGQGSYFAKAASYSHQYTDKRDGDVLISGSRFSRRMSLRTGNSLITNRPQNLPLPHNMFLNRLLSQLFPPPPAHMSLRSFLPAVQGSLSQPNMTPVPQNNLSVISNNNFSGPLPTNSSNPVLNPAPNMQSQQNLTCSASGSAMRNFSLASPADQTSASGSGTFSTSNNSAFSQFNLAPQTYEPVPTQQEAPKAVPETPPSRVVSFSEITSSSCRKMFLAKVLVGKYTGGNSSHRRPPPLENNKPYGNTYDSCVDNIWDPKIFVIFDSNQAYPEYIIEYNVLND